jgi:hypothetical protein
VAHEVEIHRRFRLLQRGLEPLSIPDFNTTVTIGECLNAWLRSVRASVSGRCCDIAVPEPDELDA